ncbi:hypothetical protein PIB30_098699 [Stylosanthes scabra]|uniref:Uncharacterized protein n=1 Tax=Stylosanthes scabra TaxID=79078 RepID=A0ABU6ZVE0_9FABA|nr:hypothetical protein [Stylosanthes scabra]
MILVRSYLQGNTAFFLDQPRGLHQISGAVAEELNNEHLGAYTPTLTDQKTETSPFCVRTSAVRTHQRHRGAHKGLINNPTCHTTHHTSLFSSLSSLFSPKISLFSRSLPLPQHFKCLATDLPTRPRERPKPMDLRHELLLGSQL